MLSKLQQRFPTTDLSFLDEKGDIVQQLNSKSMYDTTYARAAGNYLVLQLLQSIPPTFSESVDASVCNAEFKEFVKANASALNAMVDSDFDFTHDLITMKTFMKGYLLKDAESNEICELPSGLYLRVATRIHMPDLAAIEECYNAFVRKELTQASPTLFNAGTSDQLASCFLIDMKHDSIRGIYETLGDCAAISKLGGGVGLAVSKIRSAGARINSTGGISTGLPQMLRLFNETSKYVTQGGRRPGSAAIFLEMHHPDIVECLQLRLPTGPDELRTRELFFGCMLTTCFMNAVKNNEEWYLFDPTTATGKALNNSYGDAYTKAYKEGIRNEEYSRHLPAHQVFNAVLDSLMMCGTPYLINKCQVNKCSNTGFIRQSNLCCEIMEPTHPDETAVCTLASINLKKAIKEDEFDFEKLMSITKQAVRNLDKVLSINTAPTDECVTSTEKFRNIGIGVQSLADVFLQLGMVWGSEEALELDAHIFECIYLAANEESVELAKKKGAYLEWYRTPLSDGMFHFDYYDCQQRYNERWMELRRKMARYGRRHALLVALMPTASTSTLLGCNSESFEPRSSFLYVRRVLSGEYFCLARPLVDHLKKTGQWSEEFARNLAKHKGSVQSMSGLDAKTKEIFKTAYEVPLKVQLAHAAARNPYIDQSCSFNCHMPEPTRRKLSSYIFYAFFRTQQKTCMYYLRRHVRTYAMGVTQKEDNAASKEEKNASSIQEEEECEMCGS